MVSYLKGMRKLKAAWEREQNAALGIGPSVLSASIAKGINPQVVDHDGLQTSTMEDVNDVDDRVRVCDHDRAHDTVYDTHGGSFVPLTDANGINNQDYVASYAEKLAQLQLESDNLKEELINAKDNVAKL